MMETKEAPFRVGDIITAGMHDEWEVLDLTAGNEIVISRCIKPGDMSVKIGEIDEALCRRRLLVSRRMPPDARDGRANSGERRDG